MPKSKVHLPLTEPHYTALGRVAARGTVLETAIEVIIWHLLTVPPKVGRSITTPLFFDGRLKLLTRLGKHCLHDAASRKELSDILSDVKAANKLRNELIHSLWRPNEDGWPEAFSYTVEKQTEPKKPPKPWSPGEIGAVADKL